MKLKHRWWWLALAALALLSPLGCTPAAKSWPNAGNKPKVLVSFAPLYCFALNVAGDDAALKALLTNRGPHDYPYDPHDMLPLREADLFLVNGLGLDEHFSEKLAHNSGNKKLKFVKLAQDAIPKEQRPQLNVEHGDHSHSGDDPHVWLGLKEARQIVAQIARELGAVDPAHKAQYEQRAQAYIKKLEELEAYGRKQLNGKPEEQGIVTTHDAFQYFARTFGVDIVGYIQPRAGQDINPKELTELVEKCKNKKVRVIATEPQFPTASAETLLREISNKLQGQPKPRLAQLDPLETARDEDLTADWYIDKMKKNIDDLARAFKEFREQK